MQCDKQTETIEVVLLLFHRNVQASGRGNYHDSNTGDIRVLLARRSVCGGRGVGANTDLTVGVNVMGYRLMLHILRNISRLV